MTDEVVCAVPGCDNELTEEERKEKKAVCSSCELAEMHLCGICGKQISPSRIRGGATLCKDCLLPISPSLRDIPDVIHLTSKIPHRKTDII
ncbi:hypothetical protein AKJ37_07760, partial [candidate division MSBL1 archaeon SCGC-AAA259I09]